jgi:site-specific DNA-methyltransferase (adenine-specific)
MEYMAGLPDKFFDLAVVDPPYALGMDGGKSIGLRKKWAASYAAVKYKKGTWDNEIPNEQYFAEMRRVSKNQIVWGGNYFAKYFDRVDCMLEWDKKCEGTSFSHFEIAFTSFRGASRKVVIPIQTESQRRIHPTQKPVALYKWILTNYAKPGQKIFDSHLGSQSSRIAAWDLGLDFYGCEIDTEYFEAGNKRFEAHKNKPVLFAAEQMYNFEQAKLFDQ